MLLAYLAPLAQLPEGGLYFDPLRLALIVVVFVLWALFAQWVDKDTIAVNTFRILWNLVVMSGGAVAVAVALLVPNFLIGILSAVVVNLVVMITYVVHRNGLVQPQDTVLTLAHLQRIKEQGLAGKKKQVKEVKERVRLRDANERPIGIPTDEIEREQYRLCQDLLFDVFWRRAAIADIAPAGQATKITYLIDGMPTEQDGLARAEGEAVVLYLKRIAGLNLEERRKPQRGKITVAMGENRTTVVTQTSGSTAGERLRLRVIGPEGSHKVKDLGFTPEQLEAVRQVMESPRGLILLTGPAASGITTSVYSFVRSHDAFLQNIQLLEYEREVEINNVTQHLFVPGEEKTFSSDLLKLIRSDPDILVCPEMREREACTLATKAGGEKAKVYVGFAANDVFDAVRKWTAMVGDRAPVAKGLAMVTNQRLVRRLCGECKQPYRPDAGTLRKLNMPPDTVLHRTPEPQYDKHGNPILCQACQGTGYVGRIAVFQVFVINDELRKIVRSAKTIAELQAYATKAGAVRPLQTEAMHKVLDGTTSIQEIVRVMRQGNGATSAPVAQPRPAPQT
jgi:type II secretory ATPase GspE/PulE/Tfp pilus assembly ATPase PilB-like protein